MTPGLKLVEVDGSVLEGGGQILRMAFSLSVLTRSPIRIRHIRVGRSAPGLRPQHKTGLDVVRDMSNGKLWGALIGSEEVTFHPGKLTGGIYSADTGTAGSIALLVQVALPCALFCPSPVELTFCGGTNADMAPQIDYTTVGQNMNWPRIRLSNKGNGGYFPRGGGEVYLRVKPVKSLKAVQLLDPGQLVRVWGRAFVAGTLPLSLAETMAREATRLLQSELPGVSIDIQHVKESAEYAVGNGSGINLFAETSTGCIYGGSALGKRHVNAREVAAGAVNEMVVAIKCNACVDTHAQDQVIILMALAEGRSSIKCGPVTLHTLTAIDIASILTTAEFHIEDLKDGSNLIHCQGMGYQRDDSVPMQ